MSRTAVLELFTRIDGLPFGAAERALIDQAIALAEEAVKLTGWKDSAYVMGLADVYIAAGRTILGLGLKKKMRTMRFER